MSPADGVEPDEQGAEYEVSKTIELLRAETDPVAASAVLYRALANALLFEVQTFLNRTSTVDDVDLFLKVHVREPADLRSWPVAIVDDLRRRRFVATDIAAISQAATTRACALIRDNSPLVQGRG